MCLIAELVLYPLDCCLGSVIEVVAKRSQAESDVSPERRHGPGLSYVCLQ